MEIIYYYYLIAVLLSLAEISVRSDHTIPVTLTPNTVATTVVIPATTFTSFGTTFFTGPTFGGTVVTYDATGTVFVYIKGDVASEVFVATPSPSITQVVVPDVISTSTSSTTVFVTSLTTQTVDKVVPSGMQKVCRYSTASQYTETFVQDVIEYVYKTLQKTHTVSRTYYSKPPCVFTTLTETETLTMKYVTFVYA